MKLKFNLDFLKRKKNFKKRNFASKLHSYWRIIFFTGFALSLAAVFFGFYLFSKINKETIVSIENINIQSGTVKRGRIDKVLEYFSQRKEKSDEILNLPSPIVDPSL